MRRIRYAVAMSLDGYIAGPKDEADWIIVDPEIDFGALFAQFDTFLLGRRTFEIMAHAGKGETPGMKTLATVLPRSSPNRCSTRPRSGTAFCSRAWSRGSTRATPRSTGCSIAWTEAGPGARHHYRCSAMSRAALAVSASLL